MSLTPTELKKSTVEAVMRRIRRNKSTSHRMEWKTHIIALISLLYTSQRSLFHQSSRDTARSKNWKRARLSQ
jgi:hypothetical protein